jgi:hypothetical protein
VEVQTSHTDTFSKRKSPKLDSYSNFQFAPNSILKLTARCRCPHSSTLTLMVRRKARTRFCSQLQTLVAGYESYYYYYADSEVAEQPTACEKRGRERRILRPDVRGREAGGGRAAIARS